MSDRDGYMTAEAAFLLPAASILILLLVFLCSYLYQSCYMVQTAYIAAFRACREEAASESAVNEALDELLDGQALSFGTEQREIRVNLLGISVELKRDTPMPKIGGKDMKIIASWWIPKRNPAAYIRGLRTGKEMIDGDEGSDI